MRSADGFAPRWASPPGRTIRTRLDELGLNISEFANSLGVSMTAAAALLDGQETITVHIARQLSDLVGASAEFWVSRDCEYREDLIRVDTDAWLNDVPVKEMTKLGWIPPMSDWISRVDGCLSFFGVDDVATWRSTYDPIIESSRMRISATSCPSFRICSQSPASPSWFFAL